MDDKAVEQLLQSSIGLLHASLTELREFFENWHDNYGDAKPVYTEFKEASKSLARFVGVEAKRRKDYESYQDAIDLGRDLLSLANRVEGMMNGPLTIIQCNRNVAALTEQVAKLMRENMPRNASSSDDILDRLTVEQMAILSGWLGEDSSD